MRIVCGFLTFWLAFMVPPAFAAVAGEWRVNLTRSGVTTVTYKGPTEAAAWLACQAAIPNSGTGTYTCGSPKYVATVTTAPAPTPAPVPTPTPTPTPTPVPTPTPTPTPAPGATAVLYTDFVAAPLGAPLTICGKNFGKSPLVMVGGVLAPVLQSAASLNPGYDCARVAIPGGGIVSVNGVAGPAFTIQPGDIRHVSPDGNDATALANDPSKPWKNLQTTASEASGAWGASRPGDVIVIHAGVPGAAAMDGSLVRIWKQGGSAPTGVKGAGYISITGAPGEVVSIALPKGGGFNGGGTEAPRGAYVAISNLTLVGNPQGASDGAPINLQTKGDGWRVVNNDLSWPAAPAGMKAGGIVGHGNGAKLLGSYVHDIAGGPENHGIYIDGGDSEEVAWNTIQRVISGNLFQTYDAWSSSGVTSLNVHDNLLEHGGRYGLNLADQTVSGTFARNVINDTALAGIRLTINSDHTIALTLIDNSGALWNTKGSNSSRGAVNCDWNLTNGSAVIQNSSIGAGSAAASYYDQQGTCTALKFSGIKWSGLTGKVGP
jgi:hypothetical protein